MTSAAIDAPRVAIFRKDILPVSETFIAAQAASYRRWMPSLFGCQRAGGIDVERPSPRILYRTDRRSERMRLRRDQVAALAGRPIGRVTSALREIAPAIVHAHFGYDAVLVSDSAAALGLPLVVTLHGTDILRDAREWSSGRHGWFFRFYPRKLASLFGRDDVHFVAVSEALRAVAIGKGVPAERIEVAYTGIDTGRFPFRTDRPRRGHSVLFVGRLVAFKGCEFLIRAMHELRRRWPDCRLTIAGDGPARPALEDLSRRMGVDAAFLGAVDGRTVKALFAEADIFCLPSITDADGTFEAFGMVMLEAQAAGVPVATSARAAREVIVDGVTGFVFPEKDVAGLVGVLTACFERPDDARAVAKAAREHVERHFDVGRCTARIEAIYDRITAGRAGVRASLEG